MATAIIVVAGMTLPPTEDSPDRAAMPPTTATPKRSRIPDLARGLFGLSLLLCTLFLVAPWVPQVQVGASISATFVLIAAAGLLLSLVIVPLPKSPWSARAAQHTLVALLICLGTSILPIEAPRWMPLSIFVILIGGTESLFWTVTFGLGCGLLLAGATHAHAPWEFVSNALSIGGIGLASAVALTRLKARSTALSRAITKMRQGADFLETELDPNQTFRGSARRKDSPALKKVSEEARTVRDLDRSIHLTKTLAPFLQLARGMNKAHAALFFDIDRTRGGAFLRAFEGPEEIWSEAVLPLDADPVGFVLDRSRTFYATDFRSLLWSLPYYKTQKRIGTLIAVPVMVRGLISGILIVDHEESQALSTTEPDLQRISQLISQVVENERETLAHAEREVEFEAAMAASSHLAVITEVDRIHEFVAAAVKEMAPRTIGVGLLRLRGEIIEGLPGMSEQFAEWIGAGTSTSDRTWMAWYLTGPAEPMRIDTPKDHGLPLFRTGGGLPGETLLAHPLRFRNRLIGALIAVGERGAFGTSVGHVISLMANQAAAAIDLIELLEANKHLALHDGLTKLLNRRAFDEALGRAVAQVSRTGQPLSLLMIDLDHFKRLNDTFGHTVGDAALRGAAEEIKLQLRGGDMAARYGGEEFAIILPNTDGPAAFRMAERLRKALSQRVLEMDGERIKVTASCGVSATDLGYATAEALIHSADEALYASKETGRNRTSLAGTPQS